MYYINNSLEKNKIIRIIYDNKGIITERDIQVLSIKNDKIIAFCYLRKNKRTFIIENILAAEFKKEEYQ
jgi:predicted DNA-binding transcriptional regulator YafY